MLNGCTCTLFLPGKLEPDQTQNFQDKNVDNAPLGMFLGYVPHAAI